MSDIQHNNVVFRLIKTNLKWASPVWVHSVNLAHFIPAQPKLNQGRAQLGMLSKLQIISYKSGCEGNTLFRVTLNRQISDIIQTLIWGLDFKK